MKVMEFQRARSEQQREERRQLILRTAAQMLSEMSVLDLSLNELSRRVGLAKSNVLRYFETREAIFLELLSIELRTWVLQLEMPPVNPDIPVRERADQLAAEIAASLAARPLLCDLASAQATVLERNASMEIVLRHKRSVRNSVERLATTVVQHLPEISREGALQIISIALLMASAVWPTSQPNKAILAAYEEEPGLRHLHLSFVEHVRSTLELCFSGLLTRNSN
jgi:AcrR family transcriptional regulator